MTSSSLAALSLGVAILDKDGVPLSGKVSNPIAVPTVQAAAYSAGMCIGGLLTLDAAFDESLSGILQALRMAVKENITASLKVAIFKAEPSASTFNDHAAAILADADVAKLVAVVDMGSPDTTFAKAIYRSENLGLALKKADTASSLKIAIIAMGAVTFASTGSIVEVSAAILKD